MEFQISKSTDVEGVERFFIKVKKTIKPFLYYLRLKKPYTKFVDIVLPTYEWRVCRQFYRRNTSFSWGFRKKDLNEVIGLYKKTKELPFFEYKGHKFEHVVYINANGDMFTIFLGERYYIDSYNFGYHTYPSTEECMKYVDRLQYKEKKEVQEIINT